MSTESSYYVPEQSKLPIITATGMGSNGLWCGVLGYRGGKHDLHCRPGIWQLSCSSGGA